jgi:Ni,Fe-hydrogenase III component G
MTEPIITTEEIKELLKAAYASAIESQNLRREYLLLPLKERYEIMLAERDALKAEVQQSRLEFQIMGKHAQQDAAEIASLRAERDALRKDAALLDAFQAEHERFDPVCALVVKVKHDRNGSDWANVAGDVRAALTAALEVQP